jgi:CRISPR-associated exonuclease Cas4
MKEPYLEVTFRRGKPLAAYYYLPRRSGQKSYKSIPAGLGLIVDLTRSGKPIGIEITAPSLVSPADLNRVLKRFGLSPVHPSDLQPLKAA